MPDFNPEDLLSVDWEKVSNSIEDLEMSRMRTSRYFSDVDNFSIIIDICFAQIGTKIGELWKIFISTDGEPDDPGEIHQEVIDYIRDNYWNDALREAFITNKIDYDSFWEWYDDEGFINSKLEFEIKNWNDQSSIIRLVCD